MGRIAWHNARQMDYGRSRMQLRLSAFAHRKTDQ